MVCMTPLQPRQTKLPILDRGLHIGGDNVWRFDMIDGWAEELAISNGAQVKSVAVAACTLWRLSCPNECLTKHLTMINLERCLC